MAECPYCHVVTKDLNLADDICPNCLKHLSFNNTEDFEENIELDDSLEQIANILLREDNQNNPPWTNNRPVSIKDIAKNSEQKRVSNLGHTTTHEASRDFSLDGLSPTLSAVIDIRALSRIEQARLSPNTSSDAFTPCPAPGQSLSAHPPVQKNSLVLSDCLPHINSDDNKNNQENAPNTANSNAIGNLADSILDILEKDELPSEEKTSEKSAQPPPPKLQKEGTGQVFITKLGNLAGQTISGELPKPIYTPQNPQTPQIFPEAQLTETELSSQLSLLDLSLDFVLTNTFHDKQFRIFGIKTPFVGRENEIRSLQNAYEVVSTQKVLSFLRVLGESGIGKTRLVFEFLTTLLKKRYCFRLYSALPSSNLTQSRNIFETLLIGRLCLDQTQTPEAQLRDIVQKAQDYFEREDYDVALHVLCEMYHISGVSSTNRELSEIHTNKNLYFQRVREVFGKLLQKDASQYPVILVLDNNDETAFNAMAELNEMLPRFAELPILVVYTQTEKLEDQEEVQYLEIPPLNQKAISTIAKNILMCVGNLPDTVIPTLAARSQGNPRAIEQILYLLVYKRMLVPTGTKWVFKYDQNFLAQLPSNESQRMHLRFEGMPENQRAFLNVAALLPAYFQHNDVAHLLCLEPLEKEIPWFNEIRPHWAKEILKTLINLEVLVEIKDRETNSSYYRFRFPNERAYIAAQLSPEYVRTVKGSFARILERKQSNDIRIARFFEEADYKYEAAQYWLKLAQSTFKSFYNTSSLAILIHCLELVSSESGELYCHILNEMGRVASHMGQFDSAEEYYSAMLRTAYFYQDKGLSFKAFLGIANAKLVQGKFDSSQKYLNHARVLAEDIEDQTCLADSFEGLANCTFLSGQKGSLVNALRYAEKALEIRRKVSDIRKTASTLDVLAKICLARGDLDRAMTSLTEAVNAKNATGYSQDTPETLIEIAHVMEAFSMPDPQNSIASAYAIAEQTGNVANIFWAHSACTMLAIKENHLDDATVYANAMADILKFAHPDTWYAEYYRVKTHLELAKENYNKASKNVRRLFDFVLPMNNQSLISEGNYLSAMLNFEVYKRNIGTVSLQKTEKLFRTSISTYEAIGAWHEVANCLRKFADFLTTVSRTGEAAQIRQRAEKVDPYAS